MYRKLYNFMHKIDTTHFEIPSARLPKAFDGFKIVQLSDLHNKVFGRDNSLLYRAIDAERPDIVVMTGDMISHSCPNVDVFLRFCKRLAKKYPLYYVNGNHENSDMTADEFDYTAKKLREFGAVCIDNTCSEITIQDQTIAICGLCYTAEYYRGVREYKRNWKHFRPEDMKKFLDGIPENKFCILLAHNPLDFDVYAKWGADISFGGHVHGGFIRLPIVKGVFSPERTLFPKYKEGVYTRYGKTLVVSRGLGRIRFFNPPEIVSVTLRSK